MHTVQNNPPRANQCSVPKGCVQEHIPNSHRKSHSNQQDPQFTMSAPRSLSNLKNLEFCTANGRCPKVTMSRNMMKDDCNSYVSEAISVKKRPSIENRKSAMVVMKKVYHEEIAIRRRHSGGKNLNESSSRSTPARLLPRTIILSASRTRKTF